MSSKGWHNPLDSANCLQNLFASWGFRLASSLRSIEDTSVDKLPNVPKNEDLSSQYTEFRSAWDHELTSRSPSYARFLIRNNFKEFLLITWPNLISMLSQVGFSLIVAELVKYFEDDQAEMSQGVWLAVLLVLCALISNIMYYKFYLRAMMFSQRIKVLGLLLLQDKCMRLNNISLQSSTSGGKLINIAATDFDMFEFSSLFCYLWASPIFLFVVGVVLYIKIDVAGLVAIAIVVIYIPVLYICGYIVQKLRLSASSFSDDRIKLIQNLIEGIRVIKLYGWEDAFLKLLYGVRYKEIRKIRSRMVVRVINVTLYFTGVALDLLITLAVTRALDQELNLSSVYSVISLLSSAFFSGVAFLSVALEVYGYVSAGCKRITKTLLLPEKEATQSTSDNCRHSLLLEQASLSWEDSQHQTYTQQNIIATDRESNSVLSDISFSLSSGELCVVIGTVGAGKSSLLYGIMGEINKTNGLIEHKGNLAYVEQEPWILSTTVRDNIVMNNLFDEKLYKRTIKNCGLIDDFKIMTHGDLTMIGDKGINLSGGQRARIALARAVYSNRDIYLLDDPLSAVDASVSHRLFKKCISGVLKDKTRILVTHQLHVLPYADKILVLNSGRQIFFGNYEELQKNPISQEFIGYISSTEEVSKKKSESTPSSESHSKKDTQTISAEEKAKGNVPFKIYYKFLKESLRSWFFLVLLILYSLFVQAIYVFVQYWIGFWSSQSKSEQENPIYINILAILTSALILCLFIRNFILTNGILVSCERLHNKAVRSLVKTSITFFDSNPIGRVLNRFSRDMALCDNFLILNLSDFIQVAFLLLSILVYVGIIMPLNFILYVMLVIGIYLLVKNFLPVARDVRRIELLTRSPIFSQLNNTISGMINIRCFGWQDKFADDFLAVANSNMKAFVTFTMVSRAFQLYIDFCISVTLFCNCILLVCLKSWIEPETASLSLALNATLIASTSWFVKNCIETENCMTSTQRIYEYEELPPEEAPNDVNLIVSQGTVELQNVYMKYREHLDYVLKDLNVEMPGGIKVGVVGRTGAGKSSIMQILFRINNIQQGRILIDGQDIASCSLVSLRSQLSVIPQSPFIFSASARENLDPFNAHTEEEVWRALDSAELGDYFRSLPNGLKTNLASSSAALSVGQKQLICLARAILRNNKILMMDEATANVDSGTDNLIQNKVRTNFKDCTVITIAHRLQTVIDNDRILVMAQGSVKEYDSPSNLLSDPNSHLSYLVSFLGSEEQERLFRIANRA
jgi:ATP-binding cassette subfamily C (CFTR/MRP) protein 4